MRTTMCLPCCLLLACVWPSQAQQTTVKDKALINEKSASQKEPGTQTGDRVSMPNTPKPTEGAQTGNPPDSFFIAKEKEVWEALKHKDKAAATRLLADDFVGMYDTGYSTKSEWVKQIDEQYTVDDYTIENAKLLRPSANTALLLYTSTCKGTGTWAEYCSHTSRISDLWVKRVGQWVGLFSQDTQATTGERAGVSVDEEAWPPGFRGDAYPPRKVFLSPATTVKSASALEQTIVDKEKEAIEAVEKNDLKHFATLIADDFLFIGDDGLWGKREYLKSFEEDVTWEDCKMEDVRFSSSGENAAIISYKQTWTGSDHGKRFEIVIYTHGHWKKRGGQWMVTLWQDTPAEKSSTPAAETKPTLILPPSPDRPNVQAEVISHERAFLEALKRNECATASGFMSDGLVAIGVNGIKGKAEYTKLCETRQGQESWTDYELEQVQVYATRADSVVLVKKVIFSGTDQEKQFKSVEYGHEDWERHNGDWQITALQDTPQAATSKAGADTTVVNLDVHAKLTPFEEMIIGKEKEVLDLSAKGDYANWANLLSDDAVAVYDTGYASKAEVLKSLKGMSDMHCSMDKVKVMSIGKTGALIIYRMTQDWKEQGKAMALQYYISSLWVKRGGKWLSQFWQETDTTNSQGAEEKTVQNQNNSATDNTKELLQIETDLLSAYVHRDLSVRDRYVADDFVGVGGDGEVYSKQQDLQDLKDGTFAMKAFRTEGVQVRLFGDSAIVTGRNISTSVYKGKEQTDTIRYVDTFLKRDGRWQMVYSQDTNVANTTATSGEQEDAVLKAIVANDENQIIALEKRLWNGDANEVSKLEGEDYEAIKHAHRYHRADDEAAAKDVKFALTSMDDIRVRMLRPDVALITYHATQKGSFRGTEVPPSLYFGSIWVNRSGGWKNVFLEENAPDVFTDIYKPSADRAQPEAQRSEIAQSRSLDDDLSTQALAKEREILDAQNRNDWTAFAELLADDLVAIDEDGIHSKKELLEEVRAGEIRFSDYKMETVRVIPQDNGAIVMYKETLVGTEHAKPFTWHIYTHSHWERQGGKWLMTMFQDSTAKN